MTCLSISNVLGLAWATGLTKQLAIVQFPHGNSAIPSSCGSDHIMYSRVMNPADSIVAHPNFPLMLKRDSSEVFPWGYQSVIHCASVIYQVSYLSDEQKVLIRLRSSPTSGKNCQRWQTNSQFSRVGGSQSCTIAISMIQRFGLVQSQGVVTR